MTSTFNVRLEAESSSQLSLLHDINN